MVFRELSLIIRMSEGYRVGLGKGWLTRGHVVLLNIHPGELNHRLPGLTGLKPPLHPSSTALHLVVSCFLNWENGMQA